MITIQGLVVLGCHNDDPSQRGGPFDEDMFSDPEPKPITVRPSGTYHNLTSGITSNTYSSSRRARQAQFIRSARIELRRNA